MPDEEGEDYCQYPEETVRRGKGDCEDLTFLLVSMLIRADIPENLIWVNLKNWHLYTTVHSDGKMMVLETDPNPNHFYLYDLPQFRWNRQVIEERKRKEEKEMKKMAMLLSFLALVFLVFVPSAVLAANQMEKPVWKIGDTWKYK